MSCQECGQPAGDGHACTSLPWWHANNDSPYGAGDGNR